MLLDIEDLGSWVFEEMALNALGYTSVLSEVLVLDQYQRDKDTSVVVLLVNEIGKLPYKVNFEVKLASFSRVSVND